MLCFDRQHQRPIDHSPSRWADWHPAIKPKMTTNTIVRILSPMPQVRSCQDEDCEGATL